MTIQQMCQAVWDFWRPNHRGIKKYLLRYGKKHPVAIICPGGGYSMCCSFAEGMPYAKELNKRGCHAVVVLYYRCKGRARFPAPMDDLAWAVKEVFSHAEEWNLDTKSYSIWGSSAGGHLATSFGTEKIGYAAYGLPKPGTLILSYPVVSMGEQTHHGSRKNLLGRIPSDAEIARTSIELLVAEDFPPTFLWYGEADKLVPIQNSQMLYAALQQKGVACELVSYLNVGHGVGLGENLPCANWLDRAVTFWRQH